MKIADTPHKVCMLRSRQQGGLLVHIALVLQGNLYNKPALIPISVVDFIWLDLPCL